MQRPPRWNERDTLAGSPRHASDSRRARNRAAVVMVSKKPKRPTTSGRLQVPGTSVCAILASRPKQMQSWTTFARRFRKPTAPDEEDAPRALCRPKPR